MTEQQYGKLKATVRTSAGKGVARKIRAQGRIPAVLYGKGQGNTLLSIDPLDLKKCLDPERKLNTFFSLAIDDGGKESVEGCIVTDYQLDKVKNDFLHVDFLRVDENTDVTVNIPVVYTGRPKGVVLGGKLRTFRRTVRVAAKPHEVPVSLKIALDDLDPGDSIRLKTLSLPNARLLDHPETVMALVERPRGKKEGEGAAEEKKD